MDWVCKGEYGEERRGVWIGVDRFIVDRDGNVKGLDMKMKRELPSLEMEMKWMSEIGMEREGG